MNVRHPPWAVAAVGLFPMALLSQNGGAAQRPPNVILVMTDDHGSGDLAVCGNTKVQTPNLDRLAIESVRLTNFHVDPTCSPTRSALLTG